MIDESALFQHQHAQPIGYQTQAGTFICAEHAPSDTSRLWPIFVARPNHVCDVCRGEAMAADIASARRNTIS